MSDDSGAPDPEALQAEIRRRAAGFADRPLADDDELAVHAEAAASRSDPPDLSELQAAMAALASLPRGDEPVPSTRRRPRDTATDARVNELRARLDATERALTAAVEVLTAPGHRHRDLEGELDALHGRLRRSERAGAWPDAADSLLVRLEELERAERSRGYRPWFPQQHFVEAFRGDPSALEARYADLVGEVAGHGGPVLDLGCGQGELLELLGKAGVQATGVEVDPEVAATAQSKGLDVTCGDALQHLGSLPSGSLGGIIAIQVIEHLGPQDLLELVALAADRVRAGGLVVVESLNPASFYVYGHALWLDPTHARPIHPAYVELLFREAGFQQTRVQMRSLPPEAERLGPVSGDDATLVAELNHRIAQLNDLLYGPQDYAVLAIR